MDVQPIRLAEFRARSARAEHDALVTEALDKMGWAGCLLASFAGTTAAIGQLETPNPFEGVAPDLARYWQQGREKGLDAVIPAARVVPLRGWRPRPGCTAAAHTARNDG